MRRTLPYVTLALLCSACADAITTTAVLPPVIGSPATDNLVADPEPPGPVRIILTYAGIELDSPAKVEAQSLYDSYHSLIGGSLTLRESGRAYSEKLPRREQHTFMGFFNQTHSVEWPLLITQSCGTAVEARTLHEVYLLGYLPDEGVRAIFEDRRSRYASKTQPECTCAGGGGGGSDETQLINDPNSTMYDPYASDPVIDSSCGTGDGEGGTPYEPGDSTGGETVDWGTGEGNGGESVCGAEAVVEYVCIDVWEDGVGWVEWGCGYATTC